MISTREPSYPHIRESLQKLEDYILKERYAGYDPYDVLMSPIFRLPVLRSNRMLRFGAQQMFRRLPLNARPLIGIHKGQNPVTFGLCLQAFTYLEQTFSDKKEYYRREIMYCLKRLKELQSRGYSGACWGYDFDWESRYARIDAMTPTIVATGIITNALFQFYAASGDRDALDLCRSATKFVLNDLKRTYEGPAFCFSYSPHDSQVVLNATMKAARLLAQVYSVDRDNKLLESASLTVKFVMYHQQNEGGWSYSLKDRRGWADNFHTGYVLDCLQEYGVRTGDKEIVRGLRSGFDFYRTSFFDEQDRPKYYTDSTYPIDSTSAAQSILTLCRFGDIGRARRVATWMLSNMQAADGHFYYQYRPLLVTRIPYMRWSSAWMLLALSFLLYSQKNTN